MPKLPPQHRPKGGVVVLFGLLLPIFIGLAALAVDLAIIAAAKSQLMTAADSAALAGAAQLASQRRVQSTVTDLTPEIRAANIQAIAYAARNNILHDPALLLDNSGNYQGGDIAIGYLDTTKPYYLDTSTLAQLQYNTVRVTAKRDDGHTGKIPSYFAKIFGYDGTAIQATSTATVQIYTIKGYRDGSNLLPITLSKTTWEQMIAQQTTDHYAWDPVTQQVTIGSDGKYESQLYPVPNDATANWGTLQIGVTDNGTSTIGSQITGGVTAAQLATIPGGLASSGEPPSITFTGNPGISGGLKSYLTQIVGKLVTVPIYDYDGGGGANAQYRIIDFQAAVIVDVHGQGNGAKALSVALEPALVEDSAIITGTPTSWTSGGVLRLYLSK